MIEILLDPHVCPNVNCNKRIERTHLQNLPVVGCPLLPPGDIFIQGMKLQEEINCPLIQRINDEIIKP